MDLLILMPQCKEIFMTFLIVIYTLPGYFPLWEAHSVSLLHLFLSRFSFQLLSVKLNDFESVHEPMKL